MNKTFTMFFNIFLISIGMLFLNGCNIEHTKTEEGDPQVQTFGSLSIQFISPGDNSEIDSTVEFQGQLLYSINDSYYNSSHLYAIYAAIKTTNNGYIYFNREIVTNKSGSLELKFSISESTLNSSNVIQPYQLSFVLMNDNSNLFMADTKTLTFNKK